MWTHKEEGGLKIVTDIRGVWCVFEMIIDLNSLDQDLGVLVPDSFNFNTFPILLISLLLSEDSTGNEVIVESVLVEDQNEDTNWNQQVQGSIEGIGILSESESWVNIKDQMAFFLDLEDSLQFLFVLDEGVQTTLFSVTEWRDELDVRSVGWDWLGGDVVLLDDPFLIDCLFWGWDVVVSPLSPVFNEGILEFLWNQVQSLLVSSTDDVLENNINSLAHSNIIKIYDDDVIDWD